MKISPEKIDSLSSLAKLHFDEAEKQNISQELEKILDMIETLQKVNTDGVEPLIYMTDSHTVLRKDEVHQEITKEEALRNAPKKDSDFFRVPKVIESNE
jgi:aspartyl-tRNA(Asn)/glutamyl-tRNA(Gln) amidotransferase subunit C